ncbi:MAG: cobalamin biosynthesis protein CobD [Desulfarculus sp.]|nr:MAG: cobalamin biosynthesis protein CobD [Desulfarculus sp.]
MAALQLALAALLDALIGDPPHWPHSVRLMGRLCSWLEPRLRAALHSPQELRLAGLLLVLAVAGGFGLAAWLLLALAQSLAAPLGWLLGLLLSFQCLAAGQLWREAREVARPLQRGELDLARRRLAMLVGRDTQELDRAGLRRALLETLAENLNDGVVAPLFYLALGGPALAVAYKAINTLDSMVGYNNEQYRELGLVPARLDDVAGWAPARLTALIMVAACPLLGLNAGLAWRVLCKDHAAHQSPNAGWPEAAAAGALGLRLGGPNYYDGELVEKPWLNAAGRDPMDSDLEFGLHLAQLSTLIAVLLAGLAAWWLRG